MKQVKMIAAALATALLAGCSGNMYKTDATDTQLSAYAGQAVYPQISAVESPHIFCSVAPDATITIYNAGDDVYSNFELWVNKLYTVHVVTKLDAHDQISVNPGDIYNKTGSNLKGVPASSISTVQIFSPPDKLWTIQGPIIQH